ncbi:MAG: hypothetical protein Q9222_006472 [Ikaeria aurantiellina]
MLHQIQPQDIGYRPGVTPIASAESSHQPSSPNPIGNPSPTDNRYTQPRRRFRDPGIARFPDVIDLTRGTIGADLTNSEIKLSLARSSPASKDHSEAQLGPFRTPSRRAARMANSHSIDDLAAIDLTEESMEDSKEDVITEDEFSTWFKSQGRTASTILSSALNNSPLRNASISSPFRTLSVFEHNGFVLRSGVNVEIKDGSFMRIIDIFTHTRTRAVSLRGWHFQRTTHLNGIMEKKRNELCWILHVDNDDARDSKVQAMETIPVQDVVRRRRIRMTNQPWPKLSFRDDNYCGDDSETTIRDKRVLVCRYMYICHYASAYQRERNSWNERVLQRLRAPDCDKWSGVHGEPCAKGDKDLREQWRGQTIPGGSRLARYETISEQRSTLTKSPSSIQEVVPNPEPEVSIISSSSIEVGARTLHSEATRSINDLGISDGTECRIIEGSMSKKRRADIDLLSQPSKKGHHLPSLLTPRYERPQTTSMLEQLRQESSVKRKPTANRQYTFGDSFCGAGGMSRAAKQAGLFIKYGFDFNKHACDSYRLNFPNVDLYCLWAHEFVQQGINCKVDIAHLSPPCQFFSPDHTRAGKDDEMNTASLFAVGDILEKSRPRVVTLEQTFGLVLRARHQGYFNALIQIFTSHGFSIRWRLLHCADYGLPQKRLRTFIIAACPGEPLPPFPSPSHTSSPCLSNPLPAWTTINEILETVPPHARNHEPHKCIRRSEPPQSGNRAARTITCDGGGQIHPSGKRDYTIREFASLQGFPLEHVFGDVGAKKQIGNAVPPVVGVQVLRSVTRSMEKEDGVR